MLLRYINNKGYYYGAVKLERSWLRKKVHRRRVMDAFEDIEFFLKKTKLFHRSPTGHFFEFRRRRSGAIIILRAEVFGHNIKMTLYDRRTGATILNTTGGIASHKVITDRRIKKRDKKGDGVLDKLGEQVRRMFIRLRNRFFLRRLQLHICSYYRHYYFRRLLQRVVWWKIRHNMCYRILRGHNSLDSEKRWSRARRM